MIDGTGNAGGTTAWDLAQREALKSGLIKGPRLFISGARIIGPEGGRGRLPRERRRRGARVCPAPESGRYRCHQGCRGHHRRAVEGGDRRKQRRGTESARPHAEHQESRVHGHETRGAHEHDGPRAARRGREGPASTQPGSGGQSEALSAAHRVHGEAGCLHQPDAGAGMVGQH